MAPTPMTRRRAERADILVVDDLPEKHLAYQVVLEDLGQNIVAVTSGEEALKLLLERDFAVILLDVNMPGMSGLETAALIRGRKKSRHTPIIFVTAFADDVQTVEGYALGAVDYILAPVVPEILRAKVKVFVELYRMRAELARSHALLEQRVADRTAELEQTARAAACAEVHERKQAEERLLTLVQELTHRVKNLLSVFQSITSRTLTGGRSLEEAHEVLIGRLQSLGHAHELLTEASWQGADLRDVVQGGDRRLLRAGAHLGPAGVRWARRACRRSRSSCTSCAPTPPSTARFPTPRARCSPSGRSAAAARRLHGLLLAGAGRPAGAAGLAPGLRPLPHQRHGQHAHRGAGDRFRAAAASPAASGCRSTPSGRTATTACRRASPPAPQRRRRRRPPGWE